VSEERDAITLETLFANNVRWARKITQKYPDFFKSLSQMQTPQFLWIGCSDSRVAANEIVGLVPGELFVHRNVANVVCHTDFNCLAVMQYAIDVLKVNTIMVCGHYGCGGVLAAMKHARVGLVDNWLRHVDDVQQKHRKCLDCHTDETEKGDHLCELNVVEQALNVCRNDVVVNAWKRGQDLTVHALIYGMKNGLLRDLNMTVDNEAMVEEMYKTAIASLPRN
jgi:carbonic anhydrase